MILNLFKKNIAFGLVFIPIIAIFLSLPILFTELKVPAYHFHWEKYIFGSIHKIQWLNFVLTTGLTLLNGLFLNYVFNKTTFISKTVYYPAVIYLILLSFSHYISFQPYLFEHFIILGIIHFLLEINQNQKALEVSFKSSLLVGMLICFEPYYLIFTPIPIMALSIVKAFNFKEWSLSLLGLIIPIIWFFALHFLFDSTPEFYNFTGKYIVSDQLQLIDFIQIISFGLIVIITFLPLIKYYGHNKVIIKKQLLVLVLIQFLSLLSLFAAYYFYQLLDYSLFIPLAVIFSITYYQIKSDQFMSFVLTILLIINIVSLFWR
ncbi:MAG: hypothetical protein ACWA41_08725 [Putridiphycobacter sp.]